MSWWDSMASITAFAGEDLEAARYYPEDDRFLLEKPEQVEHHRVVAGSATGFTRGPDDPPAPTPA